MRLIRWVNVSCALRSVAAASVASLLGGCCNDAKGTGCLEWDGASPCPEPEVAAQQLGEVTGPGTFWPAHEYVIDGERVSEPAACCYEIVYSVCTTDFR